MTYQVNWYSSHMHYQSMVDKRLHQRTSSKPAMGNESAIPLYTFKAFRKASGWRVMKYVRLGSPWVWFPDVLDKCNFHGT